MERALCLRGVVGGLHVGGGSLATMLQSEEPIYDVYLIPRGS